MRLRHGAKQDLERDVDVPGVSVSDVDDEVSQDPLEPLCEPDEERRYGQDAEEGRTAPSVVEGREESYQRWLLPLRRPQRRAEERVWKQAVSFFLCHD